MFRIVGRVDKRLLFTPLQQPPQCLPRSFRWTRQPWSPARHRCG